MWRQPLTYFGRLKYIWIKSHFYEDSTNRDKIPCHASDVYELQKLSISLKCPNFTNYTVGAKSMSPVDIELFVIIYNITIPLCITTQIFFLWELSNLNK